MNMKRTLTLSSLALVSCVASLCVPAFWNQPAAAETPATAGLGSVPAQNDAMDAAHVAKTQQLINGGIKYLVDSREKDGGWALGKGVLARGFRPAATALALKALVQHPDVGPKSDIVQQGFKFLLTFKQKDGSICEPREGVNNYTTSLAVMALVASGDPQYKADIEDAIKYLRGVQIVPGSKKPGLLGGKVSDDDPRVGGVNYGATGQPDLSNLGMWMDAMHDAGVKPDDPAMQRALDFVTRLQNRSESNKQRFAVEGSNDGGFVYSLESSKADKGPEGKGLRSYGTMTYDGFKSMLYAGVSKKDPRVQAAYGWIRQYWRLDSNPNMPQAQSLQGLYYYYTLFAKALRAWDENEIKDTGGKSHNWRQELVDALAGRVQKDGSWVNKEESRWEEGSPMLATAYSVMALEETLKK
jgi:squalene-hopene/tetraprenyl-beta-curcumene cyclase